MDSGQWMFPPIELNSCTFGEADDVLAAFSDHIHAFHASCGRSFPWRNTSDPYRIVLSELMLQQTQTSRVLPKYEEFIAVWPDFKAMASSELLELLSRWKGLGYNRRALALREIAVRTEAWGWTLPVEEQDLLAFPMIGPATAAAVRSFCHNLPSVYLETNIRRVLIHQFHPGCDHVRDADLRSLLQRFSHLQQDHRTWYYALMDYGVYLKELIPNPNRRSASYAVQGKFENSNRQIRGMLLLLFTERGPMTARQLYGSLERFEPQRIDACLAAMENEGFIRARGGVSEQEIFYGIPADAGL